jgi:hypothetical protein
MFDIPVVITSAIPDRREGVQAGLVNLLKGEHDEQAEGVTSSILHRMYLLHGDLSPVNKESRGAGS